MSKSGEDHNLKESKASTQTSPLQNFDTRKSNRRRVRQSVYQVSTRKNEFTVKEVENLLRTIREHGHLNYDEILSALPGKTLDDYKWFLREAKKMANQESGNESQIDNCRDWKEVCDAQYVKYCARHGTLDLQLLLKLLSIDGVIDNHPLTDDAGGVDYAACYRFLQQAVVGHPLQPLNEPTALVIYEIIEEIVAIAAHSDDTVKSLKEILLQKFATNRPEVPESSISALYHSKQTERSVKTYQRKTPSRSGSKTPAQQQSFAVNGDDGNPCTSEPPLADILQTPVKEEVTKMTSIGEIDASRLEVPDNSTSTFGYSKQTKSSVKTYQRKTQSDLDSKTLQQQSFAINGADSYPCTSEPTDAVLSQLLPVKAEAIENMSTGETAQRTSSMDAEISQSECNTNATVTGTIEEKAVLEEGQGRTRNHEQLTVAAGTSTQGFKGHRRQKSSTPSYGLEEKVLRDVGINPLQLPVSMLFNVNHNNYDENKLVRVTSTGPIDKLFAPSNKLSFNCR